MRRNQIIGGDCLEVMRGLSEDSIDFICTDPPYGYSFMGKEWDKAVPSVAIWRECLRVLKPGAFMCVMSAPRSDVQCAMISRLQEAGFRLDFTPIYWTYASGFPKAGNIGKLVDKRLGVESEIVGYSKAGATAMGQNSGWNDHNNTTTPAIRKATSPQAKALDGSYAGFQPKPAVEVVIVAMKPLSEKTYVDQALNNGKGISWLDEGRIPADTPLTYGGMSAASVDGVYRDDNWVPKDIEKKTVAGRFPANLLVSDDVLNDGVERKSPAPYVQQTKVRGDVYELGSLNNKHGKVSTHHGDSGSYSRYFDLDKWASTLPWLICPKASKSEKNKGLEHMPDKHVTVAQGNRNPVCMTCGGSRHSDGGTGGRPTQCDCETPNWKEPQNIAAKNGHPTVKPLKLMSYLITLFSRPGDVILDPFVGSGTTCLAAQKLDRTSIGIEREAEYAVIAEARLEVGQPQLELEAA
jgi:site-specific DNA-methyltransferase (adenine-specific)